MRRIHRITVHLSASRRLRLLPFHHPSPSPLRLSSRCFASLSSSQTSTSAPPSSPPVSPFSHLLFDQADRVLSITLNRPTVHNAFNEEVIDELTRAFSHPLVTSPSSSPTTPRAVVLRSNGPSFSAGADLQWMKRMRGYGMEENVRDATALFDMLHAIHHCPLPVIARVQGSAYGGGVGLIAACDFAISLSEPTFAFTEVKVSPPHNTATHYPTLPPLHSSLSDCGDGSSLVVCCVVGAVPCDDFSVRSGEDGSECRTVYADRGEVHCSHCRPPRSPQ